MRVLLFFLLALSSVYAKWTENYDGALKKAKHNQEAVLLAFEGEGWCPWCIKLRNEVLSSQFFQRELKGKVELVKVNFAKDGASERSAFLQKKFSVKELPTLILIDEKEREIGRWGFFPMKAEEVAPFLKSTLSRYQNLRGIVEKSDLKDFTLEGLQFFYCQAKEIGCAHLQQTLLDSAGDKSAFFAVEQYAKGVAKGLFSKSERKKMREKCAKLDPKNREGTFFKLAKIDFSEKVAQAKKSDKPKQVLAPMLSFLKQWGALDGKNNWRAELITAEYLYSQSDLQGAKVHLENALALAPEEMCPSISSFLTQVKSN